MDIEKLDYNKLDLVSKLFLLTNNEYILSAYKNSKISQSEFKYKLSNLDITKGSYVINTTLKLNSLLKYNFKLQKITMSNLSKNLMLAKENR